MSPRMLRTPGTGRILPVLCDRRTDRSAVYRPGGQRGVDGRGILIGGSGGVRIWNMASDLPVKSREWGCGAAARRRLPELVGTRIGKFVVWPIGDAEICVTTEILHELVPRRRPTSCLTT